MKRTTAVLTAFLGVVLVAQTGRCMASESFTLNIPLRFNPQQETGEVRITLTLSAASSGAQLVVNGTTTLNLGDTQTVSGDSVKFETAGGNDVRITYKPLSNFQGDFCQAVAAVEKNIPMRFAGPQDVTSYRISSYIVASPAVECSVVSKHTGDTPATLIPVDDGVAPALVAINGGRHPFDVVLVLDKSGSMTDLPPGALIGANKITILHSAITTFVAEWRGMDLPTPEGAEWSHDRIGVVAFDSTAVPQTLVGADPPTNIFVQRGSAIPGPWDAVIGNVSSLAPGGSTTIGGGINQAMTQWQLDPAHDLSLIVVTDGIQNTAPLVAATGSGFLGLPPVGALPQELRKRFVPIQTIGFGTPATVDEDLLRNIAYETNGVSYISANASTMFDALGWTLIALLKGNTASMVLANHDTITGAGPGAAQTVIIDRSAQRVMFTVQWAPPASDALDLEVYRPNGAAAVPDSVQHLPQSSIKTFNLNAADAGTWKVRVTRGKRPAQEPVPYALNAMVLERHLDFALATDGAKAGTGDTITLTAVVNWDGKRLTGLPAGAIRIRVQRPGEGLGNILHKARGDAGQGTTTTPSGDQVTAYDRKIAALTRQGLLKGIAPSDAATIELKETGKGIYTGTFDQTTVAGSYGFEAVLDWDDSRTGHVRRLERTERFVNVKADPGMTVMKTTRVSSTTVRVAVTPRDKMGNYLGPRYASRIRTKLNVAGRASTPVDRNETGTYVITVTELPKNQPLDAEISVGGIVVGNPGSKRR